MLYYYTDNISTKKFSNVESEKGSKLIADYIEVNNLFELSEIVTGIANKFREDDLDLLKEFNKVKIVGNISGIPRVLVVVPGYGSPNVDEKEEILKHNLSLIEKTKGNYSVFFLVRQYDSFMKKINFPSVKTIYIPGFIGGFLRKYLKPNSINFEYILIILDDVVLHPSFSLEKFIEYYKKYHFDILSTSIEERQCDQHVMWTMKRNIGKNVIRVVNFIELFCYLMDKKAYERYHSLIKDYSELMWGIDCIMYKKGLRLGIVDSWPSQHRFKNSNMEYFQNAMNEWQKVKNEEGDFLIHDEQTTLSFIFLDDN